jgi:vacuolar protein-sorting-associated protein 4
MSKFQGESEKLVKYLFQLARKNAPSIIFIDEVDSLVSARSDGENESARRVKTEFLVQMDGVGKSSGGVLVLGATNTPWELDPAIRRRFERRVYIPLPESRARQGIFKLNVGDTPNSLDEKDYKELGEKTEGFSGADISVLVRDALYEPVRACQMATHFKKVEDPTKKQPFFWEPCSPGDRNAVEMTLMQVPSEQLKPIDISKKMCLKALKTAKPTVGKEDLLRFEEWTKQYGQEG